MMSCSFREGQMEMPGVRDGGKGLNRDIRLIEPDPDPATKTVSGIHDSHTRTGVTDITSIARTPRSELTTRLFACRGDILSRNREAPSSRGEAISVGQLPWTFGMYRTAFTSIERICLGARRE